MWNSISIAVVLAVAVTFIDVGTLGLSDWIYSHTSDHSKLHLWAKDMEDLAKALMPQFVETTMLLAAIAVFAYIYR